MQEPTSPLLPESAVDEIDCMRAREYALLGTLPSHSPDARLIGQLALLMGDATLGRAHALLGKAPAARASKALRGSISICLSGSDWAGCCRMRPIIWPTRCTAVRSPASVTPFGGLCVDWAVRTRRSRFNPCEVMAGLIAGEIVAQAGADREFFENYLAP